MIQLTIRERVSDSDYKYLVTRGATSYTAFHTEKGFLNFLKIANINLENEEPRVFETKENGKVITYFLDTNIVEKSFWANEELSEGAKCFKGLSNGSYVDCYYVHTEDGAVIFRPNPNAKNVYKPLSLDEHIAFSRVNG